MSCHSFGAGVVCTRGGARKRCKVRNCTADAVALCDWKLYHTVDGKRCLSGLRCSLPMCERHAFAVPGAKEKHLCAWHRGQAERGGWLERAAEARP